MNHEAFGVDHGAMMTEQPRKAGRCTRTKTPMRLLRFTRYSLAVSRASVTGAVRVSALALAAACGANQDIAGPTPKSAEVSLTKAHQAAVVGDVVIMHRSTNVAAHGGIAKVNRNFTEKISGQVRGVGKEQTPATGSAPTDFKTGVLPRPVVSLPAPTEDAMCAALPAWSRAEKHATISGRGDAPASSLTIVTEDGTVLNIERTWVRTSRTWQLARQVTTTPDSRFRDEVVYEHQSASGERIDHAIPIVACPDARGPGRSSSNASRSFYTPHTSSLASRLFPLSEGTVNYSCGSSGDCWTEQNAVYVADVAVVSTATIAAYSCMWVLVVTPATCAAAGVAWAAAVATLALAQRALNHCLYVQSHPGGEELRSPGGITLANPWAFGSTASSASRILGPPVLSADCGGGAAGPGDEIRCHYEDWEISYDGGETWSYLTTVQICEDVM
jgi:hypothetical protein